MERQRDDDEWDDIVRRLGDNLFDDVPDIIATPVTSSSGTDFAGNSDPESAISHDRSRSPDTGDDDDLWAADNFVPPSPVLPRFHRRTYEAWGLCAGGTGLLVAASVFGFTDTWSTLIGLGCLIAGGLSLLRRLPESSTTDDDDGAVV